MREPRRWPTSLDEGRPGEAVPNRAAYSTLLPCHLLQIPSMLVERLDFLGLFAKGLDCKNGSNNCPSKQPPCWNVTPLRKGHTRRLGPPARLWLRSWQLQVTPVADPGGLLQPVQRDVQQAGPDVGAA